MIKFFCDKCGKETKETHLCDECQYNELTCGFKVGDQVITDNGRVGTITNICTCDSCKRRGFYEPSVETEIGLWDIYITDTNRNNGFKSFYRIGDRVFGNIDEEAIERIKQSIKDRKCEITSLEAQLNVLKTLKEEKKV